MSDLIDRQKAIDALIAEGRDVDSRYLESERIIHESDAVESIAMLPSAQPEPRWIPCSERLPDEYGRYLTTHACSLAYEVRTNVWVNRDPSYWLFGEGPVIAWMEMPKPYKGGKE